MCGGHGCSVSAAACLAVSLLGDRLPFRHFWELSCMAHPREGVFRAGRQTRRLSLCRNKKKHISSTTVSTKISTNILGACLVGRPGAARLRHSLYMRSYTSEVVNLAVSGRPAAVSRNWKAAWHCLRAPRFAGSDCLTSRY